MADASESYSSMRLALRKFGISLNILVSVVLMIVLWGMFNYLASRHYLRWDVSRTRLYALSDKTVQVLSSLKGNIEVVVFVQQDKDNEKHHFRDIENLLKEYAATSRNISVRYVDPDRDAEQAEFIIRKYRIPRFRVQGSREASAANVIIFAEKEAESGQTPRRRMVRTADLSVHNQAAVERGEKFTRSAFVGEQLFTSAIYSLTRNVRPIVYFLEGHDEKSIDNFDRGRGYYEVANQLRRDHIEVRPFRFGEAKQLPEDCDALIIPGPARSLPDAELDIIQEYLEDEGRLFVLLDSLTESGMESFMEKWNVRVGQDIIYDPDLSLSGRDLYISDYGDHPVTKALQGINSIFYLPCSIEPIGVTTEGEIQVAVLAQSSKTGWAEKSVNVSPPEFDAEQDRQGPVSLAVAVERAPAQSVNVSVRPSRMVVCGDSDFASNGLLRGGSVDFFLASVNWLLDREELLAISPKPVQEVRLVLNKESLDQLFYLTVAGIPSSGALVGLMVWWRRRR